MSNDRTCVVCDRSYPRGTGCTNRCCGSCHTRFCTRGGQVSPGHGLDLAKARAQVRAPNGPICSRCGGAILLCRCPEVA